MKILVLNCGSSSVKFKLFEVNYDSAESEQEIVLAKGKVEKIGDEDAIISYKSEGKTKYKKTMPVKEHKDALLKVIDLLTDKEYGTIEDKAEIEAVGHRMVHGGEYFTKSRIIDQDAYDKLVECNELAPLHNPHNIKGFDVLKELLPGVKHVAVLDTAFHHTMPPHAYIYAIPYSLYEKEKIRRYGFHGTSHKFNLDQVSKLLNIPAKDLNIITCHLGNGASISAIKNGKSVDTSMGFTPLEGLVMGTRSGDIDPAILLYLAEHKGYNFESLNKLLNKKSGLIGISNISNDMRELEIAEEQGNEIAKLAIDIFCYRIKKYIGAYAAALGRLDAITFTAGIGENSAPVREKVCEGLDFFGIKLDKELNESLNRQEGVISTADSKVKILIIPTDEELVIARETIRCLLKINNTD